MRNSRLALGATILITVFLAACKKEQQSPASAEAPAPPKKETTAPAPAAAPALKGEPVVLKVKWPVGNYYSYRLDMEQHVTNQVPQMPKPIQQNMTSAMTYGLNVTKETPDGGRELELEFKAIEIEVKMGEQVLMSFDSKESGKDEGQNQNPFIGPFKKMVGSKVHLQVDKAGKMEKVLDHDEWIKSVSGDAGPGGGMIAQQFGEPFFRQICDFGAALPDKPVQVGQTWPFKVDMPAGPMGKLALNAEITFRGWEDRDQHKCAALDAKGSFKSSEPGEAGPMGKVTVEDGQTTGTSWLDPDLGAVIESENNQIIKMKGEISQGGRPGMPSMNFNMNMGQKVTVKLVDFKAAAK